MKVKKEMLVMMFIAVLAFSGCSDDDNDGIKVPEVFSQALKAQYPSAKRIEWEQKGNFYVADCRMNGKELDVWYNTQTEWKMTETNLLWNDLPGTVQTAFNSSEYAGWRRDDVDLLEYPVAPMVYIIEVERGYQERQLFYSKEGNLIQTKDVTGMDDTHWPQ